MADIRDMLRLFRKLSPEEKKRLDSLKGYVSEDIKTLSMLLKQDKLSIAYSELVSGNLLKTQSYPVIRIDDKEYEREINGKILDRVRTDAIARFKKIAKEKISSLIGSDIVGFEMAKKAIMLQLFSREHFHILLLGDPGTGKTVLLHAASALSPISSFGLGSGTSGAGLALTMQAKEIQKGLLPMADGGVCCIDELNLLKEDSRGSLYNAMEKGFVTYDKGGKHHKFDARVSVLATANPKGDRFKGETIKELKRQIPFDDALLSRFHVIFFILRPDEKTFKEIAKNIVGGKKERLSDRDAEFVKDYIGRALRIEDVKIPSEIETKLVDMSAAMKKNEKSLIVDISPRMVVGLLRMIKASARADLRDIANNDDLDLVVGIIRSTQRVR